MPTHLHQEFSRTPGYTVARMVAFSYPQAQSQRTLAPVAIALFDRMEASGMVEKDGTGIGTGTDTECQPVLGAWSGLAQDVLMEHGRSRTLFARLCRRTDATACRLVC